MKQWPAAQHCGALFDELRKGGLTSFRDENTTTVSTSIEAKQLRELVFRENADLLYARDQSLSSSLPLASMVPDINFQDLALEFSSDLDYLEFFQFPETSDLDLLGLDENPGNGADTSDLDLASGTDVPHPPVSMVDETQLSMALQRLPVCTHCKRRRIKCDMALPACRSCTKLKRECCFWDTALSQEISRKYANL